VTTSNPEATQAQQRKSSFQLLPDHVLAKDRLMIHNIPQKVPVKDLFRLLKKSFPGMIAMSRFTQSKNSDSQLVIIRLSESNAMQLFSKHLLSKAHEKFSIGEKKLFVSPYYWHIASPKDEDGEVGQQLRLRLMPGFHFATLESTLKRLFEPLKLKGWKLIKNRKDAFVWNKIQWIQFDHQQDAEKVYNTFGDDALEAGTGFELRFEGLKIWVGKGKGHSPTEAR
jgi:hypothetical protein